MLAPPRRVVVAAVVLVGALGACSADREETTAPPFGSAATTAPAAAPTAAPIRSIAMVGDSITNGSEVELREQLATLGVEIRAIDAEDGRRMTSDGAGGSGLQAVQELALAGPPPDLWVIALGTNDVGVYEADAYALAIAELLAAVPAGAPLVWVDVYLESIPERSEEFNEVLREQLDARGAATVVDWAGLAEEDGVLRDGIHPSGFGIEQFAGLVTAAVGEWVG